MAISYDLISEFAKITNDNKKENKETNTYGKIVMYGDVPYVKLDGSEIITPCTTMIAVEDGDRVAVQIKNHNAFITGGITNPAASTKQMSGVKEEVAKFNTVVTDKLVASDIEAINGYFQQLTVVAGRYDDLTAATAKIDELKGRYASFDRISADDIKSMNAEIDNLKTMMINAEGITTEDLKTVNAQIGNLTAYNASFGYLSAEELRAIKANIKELNVTKLDAEEAEIKYANINFSNIKMAAIEHLFSESGIIKDITSETGKITGELVGVTIKGDLIEGNTVTADKLVILGEDGAYYKLNIDGLNNISTSQAGKFEAVQNEPDNWETNYKDYYEIVNNEYVHLTDEEVPEWISNKYYKLTSIHGQGLDGTNIIAQTITADKITVSDLVAFGATIGGFHITNHSLYSGAKSSAINTTRGVFMNDNGEFAIGDSNNYLRYYLDENTNTYKLEISAGTIEIGGTGKTVEETLEEIEENLDNIEIGGRNYVLGTSKEWSDWWNPESTDTPTINRTTTIATFQLSKMELKDDEYIAMQIEIETEGFVEVPDEITLLRSQGRVNGVWSGDSFFNNPWNDVVNINGIVNFNKQQRFTKIYQIPASIINIIKNYGGDLDLGLRCDYANKEAKVRWRCIKIEKGNKNTDWTQAPEDMITNLNTGLEDLEGRIDINDEAIGEVRNIANSKVDAEQAEEIANNAVSSITSSEAWMSISSLDGAIRALTNNEDGTYQILEQQDGEWTFQLGQLFTDVKTTINQLKGDSASGLSERINQLDKNTKYIRMTTYEGKPAIVIGMEDTYVLLTEQPNDWGTNYGSYYILNGDNYEHITGDTAPTWEENTYYYYTESKFEVRITNTAMEFLENGNVIAYVNNNAFYNTVGIVREEIKIVNNNQGFSWKTRANGNLGLQWIDET